MNRFAKRVIAAALTAGMLCAASVSALAAPNTDGSYKPSIEKAREKITARAFLKPDVTVNPRTFAINNVYDADGNLVPATLSSDGHFYIVPTTSGNILIGTGW